jgi:hypothetical protein
MSAHNLADLCYYKGGAAKWVVSQNDFLLWWQFAPNNLDGFNVFKWF